jgi:hypothetical protein
MATKYISQLAQFRPPSWLHPSLQVHRQTRSIATSKCISKLAPSVPSSVSPHSHDSGLLLCTTTASEFILMFTRSWCGVTVQLLDRQPIINTLPHLTSYLMKITETAAFWLKERRKRVRGYEGIPGHYEPHKLCGSLKSQLGWVRPRSGKGRVCISYNAKMSIYPVVSDIYTDF